MPRSGCSALHGVNTNKKKSLAKKAGPALQGTFQQYGR